MNQRRFVHSLSLSASLALSTLAGQAIAQTGTPAYVSGFLHTPLGRAVLSTPSGRAISALGLSPSGQDGVSIRCNNFSGAACDLDLAALFAAPSARVQGTFSDGESNPRGTLNIARQSPGVCNLTADFSSSGAQRTGWIVKDFTGRVLAEGQLDGPQVGCRISGPATGQPSSWRVAHVKVFQSPASMRLSSNSHLTTISGLTPAPITGVGSIEFYTIICITSPCPGQGGSIGSMNFTASGLNSLTVSNATGCKSVAPGSDPPATVGKSLEYYATTGIALADICDLPPPVACAPVDRKILASNLGSSGNDGVTLDFTSAASITSDNIIHRDLAARNILLSCRAATAGAAGGTPGGELTLTTKGTGKNYVGHVTLIKQRIRPNPATGNPVHYFDATARGAVECRIEMLTADGIVIGTVVGGVGLGFEIGSCPTPGFISYTGSCDADGRCTVQCCTPRSFVRCSTGQIFDNVAQLRCTPINPTEPAGLIELCEITGADVPSITVDSVRYDTPIFADGLPHLAKGRASVSLLASGNLRVSNLGSSGQDGVECLLRTRKGGHLSMDATPMLGAASADRAVTASYKGWDGSIKGSMTVRTSAAGFVEHSSQFSPQGISAVRIQARDTFGNIVGDVTYSGSSAIWSCAITPDNPAASPPSGPPVGFEFACGKKGLNAVNVSIIHRVHNGRMTLSLPDPATGGTIVCDATELSVTPVSCAGCNNPWGGTASITLTSAGLSSFDLTGAALETFDLPVSGAGLAVLTEDCEDAATCSDSTVSVHATNIGATDADGLSIDLGKPVRGAAVSISTSWGFGNGSASTGSLTTSFPSDNVGHPSLIKFIEDETADGARTLRIDATGNGSPTCSVTFFDESGRLLGAARNLPTSAALLLPAVQRVRRFSCELYVESVSFKSDNGPFPVTVPGAAPLQNVSRFIVVCDTPAAPLGSATGCLITGRTVNPIKLGGCILRPPMSLRGIPVQPIGQATGQPLVSGGLAVSNIGSSGNDGVSVGFDSRWGGSVVCDGDALLADTSPNATPPALHTTFKGWDGTIKGRLDSARIAGTFPPRLACAADFSSIGAIGIEVKLLDATGATIDSSSVAGPRFEYIVSQIIPDSATARPQLGSGRGTGKASFSDLSFIARYPFHFHMLRASCDISSSIGPPRSNVVSVEFTPIFPPGSPPSDLTIASADLTADGLTALTLTDASMSTFDVTSSGTGGAILTEYLSTGPIPAQSGRVLSIENMRDPQLDGVSVDFGPGAAGISMGLSQRGHHIKEAKLQLRTQPLGAAAGQPDETAGRITSSFNPAAGTGTFYADFTALGAPQYRAELLDSSGALVQIITLPAFGKLYQGSSPSCDILTQETWSAIDDAGTPVITLAHCSPMSITAPPLPSIGGVFGIRFTPVGQVTPTGLPRRFVTTGSFTSSAASTSTPPAALLLTSSSRTEPTLACSPADISGGGADGTTPDGIVDGSDFVRFINSFSLGDVTIDPAADISGGGPGGTTPDGIIDGSDFITFINAFSAGC